ncbi:hypothetical protein M422DRAFT_46803 [Sphaerobolus stellatus SS14]|uniref:Zn(2)-C6 fungal-type domain-containing protein n=1 Tax=Sphaerobolus stellatus (strain SS14) TaxID=990650 RepID=A0A0C9W2S5_SPHS4|nr:hypothetical protein M422DRAFT_46803 [Sphaerobolus stellatus SS14]
MDVDESEKEKEGNGITNEDKGKGKSREDSSSPPQIPADRDHPQPSSSTTRSSQHNPRRPSISRMWEDNHERNIPSSSRAQPSSTSPSQPPLPPPPPPPQVQSQPPSTNTPTVADAEAAKRASKTAKELYEERIARVRTAINSRGAHMAVVPGPPPDAQLPLATAGNANANAEEVPGVPLELGSGPGPAVPSRNRDRDREEHREKDGGERRASVSGSGSGMHVSARLPPPPPPPQPPSSYERERRGGGFPPLPPPPPQTYESNSNSQGHGRGDTYGRAQPPPPPPSHGHGPSSLPTPTHSPTNSYTAHGYERGLRSKYPHDSERDRDREQRGQRDQRERETDKLRENEYEYARTHANDHPHAYPHPHSHSRPHDYPPAHSASNPPPNSNPEHDAYREMTAPQPVPHHLSLEYQRQFRSGGANNAGKDRKGKRRSTISFKEDPLEAEPLTSNPPTRSPTLSPVANYNPSSQPVPKEGSMFGIMKPIKTGNNYTPYASSSGSTPSGSPTMTRALPSLRDTLVSPTLPAPGQRRPQEAQTPGKWGYAEGDEYEDDEGTVGGLAEDERPKKRRRTRIALSCAECKRRKFKCDRLQPCTPCTRRGDQTNCKWTVNENRCIAFFLKVILYLISYNNVSSIAPPRDGAPTRAEFDALQARLMHVERLLQSMVPNYAQAAQPPPQPQRDAPAAPQGNPYPTLTTPSDSGRRGSVSLYPPNEVRHAPPDPPPDRYAHHPPPPHYPSHGQAHGGYTHGYAHGQAQVHGHTQTASGPVFQSTGPTTPGSPERRMMAPQTTPVVKLEDQAQTQVQAYDPPASSTARSSAVLSLNPNSTTAATEKPPTLKLLPEALRKSGGGGRLSGSTFPLSDADWEQLTSVALAGANKQRAEAGSMHVDVQKELEALVGTLPSKESCDKIWACYVERLEWQHCILHPGLFQQMHDTFWAFKTHTERAACTPISWLALFLIVMSHGLCSMGPSDATKAGIAQDTAHWRMMCTQLWIASERALALDNFSKDVTVEVVQTLLDPKGWHHQSPILAMAIRLSMSIGLNNVVNDTPGDVPPPGLFKRELWRRIWYNVVYLDWRFSVPIGDSYFITDTSFTTELPANLEWHEMAEGAVFKPNPRNVFACDTLHHATRNGIHDVTRLLYDHELAVNDTITHQPPCLISRDERGDAKVQWARITHNLELDYRAIQIHRAFLVADFREARARTVCVDTAAKMLLCFMEGRQINAPNVWWWYGYIACVVLMMEQYYADPLPTADVARLNHRLDSIGAYVAMQRTNDEVTHRAWDGVLILETLISELQRRRKVAAGATPHPSEPGQPNLKRSYDQVDASGTVQCQSVTRVPTSSPIHSFRKWILSVIPFLKLTPVPGIPSANPRQRDMDASFWDAILDLDTETHKTTRRSNFGKV